MAIYRKGGDPDAMDRSAANLRALSHELRDVRCRAGAAIQAVRPVWAGADLQAFTAQWDRSCPQFDVLERQLRTMGERLTVNADAQRVASGDSTPLEAGLFGVGLKGVAKGVEMAIRNYGRRTYGRFAPRGLDGRFVPKSANKLVTAIQKTYDANWVPKAGEVANYGKWMKGAKVAGVVGTVISGGIAAFDSWQQDTAQHPGMSNTEKGGRAATVGLSTAGGAAAGAWAGAQAGAMIGAFGGPVGAAAGALIGGAVGGFLGSQAGEALGNALKEPVGKLTESIGNGLSNLRHALRFW